MKHILYISNTPRKQDLDYLKQENKITINACNYNHQLMQGFMENDCSVIAYFDSNYKVNKKVESYIEQSIEYKYLNNLNFIEKIIFFYKEIRLKPECIVFFDALNLTNSIPMLLASRILGRPSIAVVTDLFRFVEKPSSLKKIIYIVLGEISLYFYTGFLLLSENMKNLKFTKFKRVKVAEGIYEPNQTEITHYKNNYVEFLYSGSIKSEYGILKFMEAFKKVNQKNIKLNIYSSDPIYSQFEHLLDEKILFHGYVSRDRLLMLQKQSDFLINPRPINLKFNPYSFPSKLIEYMGSGRPTITTFIPSLTKDMKMFINIIYDDSINGIYDFIQNILNEEYILLENKAYLCQQHIISNYNPKAIANKIIQMASE